MSKKAAEIKHPDKWIKHLEGMLKAEKERVAGYEQVAQVHSAYISILLKRLGATEGNAVVISPQEITEAIKGEPPRANVEDGTYKLYYVVEE